MEKYIYSYTCFDFDLLNKWNIKPYSCLAAKQGKLSFEILARKKIVGMETAASDMILKFPRIHQLVQTQFIASNPGIYGSGVIHLVSTKTMELWEVHRLADG